MLMRFKKVVVGGTFDYLHLGHKALIEKAFEVGRQVIIGLTSDEMIKKNSAPYIERKKKLKKFLKSKNYEILELKDPYGPAIVEEEIEAIVVSKETRARAAEINEIRKRRGLAPLEIVVVPFVLSENGRPISSERIRKGEIDAEGRVL